MNRIEKMWNTDRIEKIRSKKSGPLYLSGMVPIFDPVRATMIIDKIQVTSLKIFQGIWSNKMQRSIAYLQARMWIWWIWSKLLYRKTGKLPKILVISYKVEFRGFVIFDFLPLNDKIKKSIIRLKSVISLWISNQSKTLRILIIFVWNRFFTENRKWKILGIRPTL